MRTRQGEDVVFDQPWPLPNPQVVRDMMFFEQTGHSYLVSNFSYSKVSDELFYVGVHVRRGIDIVMNERNRRHGHVAATADYYRRAMQMAKGDHENVCFCTECRVPYNYRSSSSCEGVVNIQHIG
uniref:Glycosyltransferase n=1 Tax=Angiostrongylus cantonensis TaxID=6313 RepID=A0A0K0DDQ9_ANGCA